MYLHKKFEYVNSDKSVVHSV